MGAINSLSPCGRGQGRGGRIHRHERFLPGAIAVCLLHASLLCARAAGEGGPLFAHAWSSCTTYYQTGLERARNIRLAAELLNGAVLQPGAGFSFNESVTWRIPREELGYAPAFFDGQLLPAAGGGLCQASSTLYAAVLGAGLAVTGRRSHSRPVTYIALGLDATVSAPEGIDLTCRNDYAFPVMIEASARDGALAVAVRAPVARDREITLSPGAPFRDGRHLAVVVTRLVRRDGREAREIVSRDYYLWP